MLRLHAGFELIAIWSEKMVESSMEMAELENASPHEAEKWLISLRFTPNFKLFTCNRNQNYHEQQLLMLLMNICCSKCIINNINCIGQQIRWWLNYSWLHNISFFFFYTIFILTYSRFGRNVCFGWMYLSCTQVEAPLVLLIYLYIYILQSKKKYVVQICQESYSNKDDYHTQNWCSRQIRVEEKEVRKD